MGNWLKKNLPDAQSLSEHHVIIYKYIKAFHYVGMWNLTQESAARAAAAGLFAAMIPIMPFQMIIAVLSALFIRGNIPLALAACWVSNPLTLVPITYFTFYLGNLFIGESPSKIQEWSQNFLWSITGPHSYWESLTSSIQQYGEAFFVGLPLIAIGSAILGYLGVKLAWKASIFIHHHWRKKPKAN